MKGLTALVAEGGVMQGSAALGVLYGLDEIGIKSEDFNFASGASSSAYSLSYWVANQIKESQLKESGEIWGGDSKRVFLNRTFLNKWRALIGKDILNLDYLVHKIVKQEKPLDVQALKKAKTELFVPLLDYETAEPALISNRDAFDWFTILEGCSALPGAYNRPVEIDGRQCIDGGLVMPVPIRAVYRRAKILL